MLSEKYFEKPIFDLLVDVMNSELPWSYLIENIIKENNKEKIEDAIEKMLETLDEKKLIPQVFDKNFMKEVEVYPHGMVGGVGVTRFIFGVILTLQSILGVASVRSLPIRPIPPSRQSCTIKGYLFNGVDQVCQQELDDFNAKNSKYLIDLAAWEAEVEAKALAGKAELAEANTVWSPALL